MRKTLMVMLAAAMLAAAADVAVELEAAIRRETVQGDVKGAVEAYRKIAASAGKNREVAARALLRLGLAYRRLGDTQARQTLERLVKEYGDQPRMVDQARSELARLGSGGAPKTSLSVRQLWRAGDLQADSISRDGTMASVMDWKTANVGVRNLRTGEVRMLTSFGNWNRQNGVVCCTRISPDGRWVAFRATVERTHELRVIRSDGAQMTTIFRAAPNGYVVPLDWMPDGRGVLALVTQAPTQPGGSGREDLVVVAVSGGQNRTVKQGLERKGGGIPVTAVSPDGRWIALSTPPAGTTRIIAVDNGGESPFGSGAGVIGWSPDSSMLLYVGYGSGAPGIYRVAMEGGRPKGPAELIRPMTAEPNPIGVDGNGTAYYREGIFPTNAYVMGIDAAAGRATGTPVRVTNQYEDWNFAPLWSPDGSKLAWFAGHSDSRRLFVKDLGRGTESDVALQIQAHMRLSPTWLSDGRIMTGTRGGDVPTVLYKLDPATGLASQVYSTGRRAQVWGISWSADGKVYETRQAAVSEAGPGGGQGREIFRDAAANYIRDVVPSPDGRSFAYVAHQDAPAGSPEFYGPVHIKIYDTASAQSRELVAVRPSWNRRMMAWTPDGSHLIYATEWYAGKDQPTRLWVVPAAGGTPKQLGADFKGRVFSLTVSPDGRQLGFEEGFELNELWAMEGAFGR